MIVSDWLTQVNYALRGTDDDTPASTDEDGTYWLTLLNRKKSEMYRKHLRWESAYSAQEIDTIAAGDENIFELSTTATKGLLVPSEQVYVIDGDGQRHYYDVIKSDEIDTTKQQVYISGQNPETITFTATVQDDDAIVGGTLYVPGYWEPADIDLTSSTLDSKVIPIDDPYWSVLAVAAQIAFNDITYEDKFNDLNGQSNELWKDMVRLNRSRTRGNARKSVYSVYRIKGSR